MKSPIVFAMLLVLIIAVSLTSTTTAQASTITRTIAPSGPSFNQGQMFTVTLTVSVTNSLANRLTVSDKVVYPAMEIIGTANRSITSGELTTVVLNQQLDRIELTADITTRPVSFTVTYQAVCCMAGSFYLPPATLSVIIGGSSTLSSSGPYTPVEITSKAEINLIQLLNTKVNSLNTTITALVTNVNSRLVSLEGKITSISDNVISIKTDIGTIKGTIQSIQGDIATIKTDISTIKGTIQSVQGDTATIKTSIGTLTGPIQSIEGDTATIRANVGTMKVQIPDLIQDSVVVGIQNNGETLQNNTDQLSRLQDLVNEWGHYVDIDLHTLQDQNLMYSQVAVVIAVVAAAGAWIAVVVVVMRKKTTPQ